MKQILVTIGLLLSAFIYCQEPKSKDFLSQIEKQDISDIWTLRKLKIENDTLILDRPEPLGFIGENFQRFYIHFISVIQNQTDKLIYYVYGKTKLYDNICSFQGQIVIKEVRIYVEDEVPPFKTGFISGTYTFFEDSKQKGSGKLTGTFTSNFYIDKKGRIKYETLTMIADGYCNNQFIGTWTGYKTNESKKCNWGDYRMPGCEWQNGCDIGAGEFSIHDRYLKYGWESYNLAWNTYPETTDVIKARIKECEKWWLENGKKTTKR